MNYYLKKRLHYHISRSDMAQMLGIDYSFYYAIEKGDVKMPINLIGKFNEIINRGKENEIITAENEIKADAFWEEVKQKNERGKYVLVDKMHEFNIYNYETLAQLLGYKSVGTIYNYLLGINEAGKEFKKRLYNFFSDELNIQIPKKVDPKTKKIKKFDFKHSDKEIEFFNKFKLFDWLNKNDLTPREFAKISGVSEGSLYNFDNWKGGIRIPMDKTIKAIRDAVKQYEKQDQETPKKPNDDYISKQQLLAECQAQLEEDNAKIQELQKQIEEIKTKSEITTKFIAMIQKL